MFIVQADIDWPIPSREFNFLEMDFPMGGELKPKAKVNSFKGRWLKTLDIVYFSMIVLHISPQKGSS